MSLSHTVCLVTATCHKSSSVICHFGWEFSHQKLSLDSLCLEHHIRADIIKTELTTKKRSQSTPAITAEIHGAKTWESCNRFTIKEMQHLLKHTANSLRTFNVRFSVQIRKSQTFFKLQIHLYGVYCTRSYLQSEPLHWLTLEQREHYRLYEQSYQPVLKAVKTCCGLLCSEKS